MALILHLTDIHIGDGKFQEVDDHKSNLIKYQNRRKRLDVYISTLKALSEKLIRDKRTLDYVVISGDITVQNDESGYKLLDSLIKSLGKSLPIKKNIIIVPGNHDVKWKLPEDDPSKYSNFNKYVTSKGYSVPYLEGFHDKSYNRNVLSCNKEKIQFLIVNTSHYCGLVRKLKNEKQWELIKSKGLIAKDLINEIEGSMLHDMARVSPEQIRNLNKNLKDNSDCFRIAIHHHPITPVSLREENKAFENLTNIGEFRNFLFENNVNLVLHGHKHTQATFWDFIPNLNENYNHINDQNKTLIVSGSLLGTDGSIAKDICRLLEIKNDGINKKVEITSIDATIGGKLNIKKESLKKYYFNGNSKSKTLNTIISGENIHDTYSKILSHFEKNGSINDYNIICEIKEVAEIEIPRGYLNSSKRGEKDLSERVERLVHWWQKKQTNLKNVNFTHGSRLGLFGENQIDQLDFLARSLADKISTSKAIAILYNPDQDSLKNTNKGPHFCLLQATITEKDDQRFLNCVAYFRKQEMRHWWIINISEIIYIMNEIIYRYYDYSDNKKKLILGSITTHSTKCYLGKENAMPSVAIPEIDILFDSNDGQLDHMIYSLVYKSIPNRIEEKTKWNSVFNNLIPSVEKDPNGIPVSIEGLSFCLTRLDYLLNDESKKVKVGKRAIITFREKLEKLYILNKDLRDGEINSSKEVYGKWRSECDQTITKLKQSLNTIYKPMK